MSSIETLEQTMTNQQSTKFSQSTQKNSLQLKIKDEDNYFRYVQNESFGNQNQINLTNFNKNYHILISNVEQTDNENKNSKDDQNQKLTSQQTQNAPQNLYMKLQKQTSISFIEPDHTDQSALLRYSELENKSFNRRMQPSQTISLKRDIFTPNNNYNRSARRDRSGEEIKKGSKRFHITFRDQIPTDEFTQESASSSFIIQNTSQNKVLPITENINDPISQPIHYSDLQNIDDKNLQTQENTKDKPPCKCTCATFGGIKQEEDIQENTLPEQSLQDQNQSFKNKVEEEIMITSPLTNDLDQGMQDYAVAQQSDDYYNSSKTLDFKQDMAHLIITGDFNELEKRPKTTTIRQPLFEVKVVESYKKYNKKPAPWQNNACFTIF